MLGAAVSARADGPTFTSIDFPGATSTSAWGINTQGDIVGGYLAPDKSDHGFLLSGGQYRAIDFPGASATEAFTINPRGDFGGFYTMAGISHGYLLSGGQFTTIDFPGAASSEVGGINARGDILGDYTLAGLRHGYLLSAGTFSSIDVPGATNTVHVAFNPQGDVIATGAFTQIGPGVEGSQGLVSGSNGSLFTLAFTGTLNSINPTTGVATVIGPTGLADCSTPPISSCGPHSSNAFASVGGRIYATDFANNLYGVDATTGAASLIGPTGIPALPFTPITVNPDGTFNAYDEALFGANGKLYATFDAFTVDPNTYTPMLVQPKLATVLALLLSAIPASAGTLAYIVTGNPDGSGNFGVIDLASWPTSIPALGL